MVSKSAYYAFGSLLPGRNYNSGSYRFGFGGHEKWDEVHGSTGSIYDFGDFGLDTRIGRRWNVDPLDQPDISPYAVFNDNPIYYVDPDGESPFSILAKQIAKAGLKKATKELIEAAFKKRMANYMGNKWARQMADDALTAIDMATGQSWWEYALERVPVVGDAYGGYKLTEPGSKSTT